MYNNIFLNMIFKPITENFRQARQASILSKAILFKQVILVKIQV
jgi:hypothetical protein